MRISSIWAQYNCNSWTTKKELCLRRRLSSPTVVVRHIDGLQRKGFDNYGYKFVWQMWTMLYNIIGASQQTVRLVLRVIYPDGVILRSRNRLRILF